MRVIHCKAGNNVSGLSSFMQRVVLVMFWEQAGFSLWRWRSSRCKKGSGIKQTK